MCVLSIKVPVRKKSGNLFNDPRIDLVWSCFMAYQPCRLFNAKFTSCMYIKFIGFGLVGFYGISTIVGYVMPNPLYTSIKYI